MHTLAADSSNTADWISAIGQAIGALFTAAAVMVALRISHNDSRHRTKDERVKAKAQAKLVLIDHVEFQPKGVGEGEGDSGHGFTVGILNIGDRPILDVTLQVLIGRAAGLFITSEAIRFIDPNHQGVYQFLGIDTGNVDEIFKWRVYWEDPDGIAWEHSDTGVGKLTEKEEDFLRHVPYGSILTSGRVRSDRDH